MTDSIILIGPRQWGQDHVDYLTKNTTTSIQYSARVSPNDVARLEEFREKLYFNLFIYVPRRYTCGDRTRTYLGSGEVEYFGNVIDFVASQIPISSPWPTILGPRPYDKNQSFQYEYWFKVDFFHHLTKEIDNSDTYEDCNWKIYDFDICLTDGSVRNYSTIDFARIWRGKIVFADNTNRVRAVKI